MACLCILCGIQDGNIALVPVDIAYDKVLEETSMISEMMGKPKVSESLWGLCRVR